jgi:hypothetical protein
MRLMLGSGKSMLARRFVHNIKRMMTPKPDRILWCYGEYQTLYGTVEGREPCNGHCDLWFYGVFLDETDSERCT